MPQPACQIFRQLARRLIALLRRLLHRLPTNRRQVARHAGNQLLNRTRRLAENLLANAFVAVGVIGAAQREQFVQRDTKAPDVGASVELVVGPLLRGHVLRRAADAAGGHRVGAEVQVGV